MMKDPRERMISLLTRLADQLGMDITKFDDEERAGMYEDGFLKPNEMIVGIENINGQPITTKQQSRLMHYSSQCQTLCMHSSLHI